MRCCPVVVRWFARMALFLLPVVCGDRVMAAPAASALLLPLTAADVDFAACRVVVDGKVVEGDFTAGIEATLGLHGDRGWAAPDARSGKRFEYVLVLKQPKDVGSVLFQRNGSLRYLKAGAALPADPAKPDIWEEVRFPERQSGARLAALPPGVRTQAFLCTVEGGWGDWRRFHLLRLLEPRLHNIVPDGLANAEAEYISYGQLRPPIPFVTANITRGSGAWQSHGPDTDNRIARRPVTDIDPCWFVVSWPEPHELSALYLDANFVKYKLLAWNGPAGLNPALGAAADWERVKYTAAGGMLQFPPVKTRALKFLVDKAADAQFGKIEALHAYVNLLEAPVPPRQDTSTAEAPRFKIPFNLPQDCAFAMAIDDTNGRRVRTLAAREPRKAGDYHQGWDLKDDAGAFVSPGSYRWKAIINPGLQIKYEMTPYPNIGTNAPDNSPWLNGESGPGGWLADHSSPRAACAAGDRIFFSAPCCESGVGLIDCDLDGRKSWGHGNIIAWTGPSYMASDAQYLYTAPQAGDTDYVWRFSLKDHKMDTLLQLNATATRARGIRGLAARDGKLYMSVSGGSDTFLTNALSTADVDQERCEPRYPKPKERSLKHDDPDFPQDFLRLFRLTSTPPGCKGLTYLETAREPAARQHIVLAFKKPVPVGSFVFPLPEAKSLFMRISILKPTAAYPPAARQEEGWTEVWRGTGKGWTVVAAPENTLTRAVRLSFDHGMDELDEVIDQDDAVGDGTKGDKKDDSKSWRAQLEGMKILRRRFANLFPTCTVKVNSGTVNKDGEWDAQRTRPLTADNPGIYMMAWDKAQAVRGLAIKEIDGRLTEIDTWTGAGAPDLATEQGWENLATYEQKQRYYYQPDQYHNSAARYMDGYVDFGREVSTRALRLRVMEQWMWKEEGRAGCMGVRKDRGGDELDPTRCRIYGVAPLQYVGGENPVDAAGAGRLEVYDVDTRKLAQELPLARAGDLALGPAGELYAVTDGKVARVEVAGAKVTPLALDVKSPMAIVCDKAGNLYVYDSAAGEHTIKVFAPDGKRLRTIGTPGGRIAGPWDPQRFASKGRVAVDLEIDARDQLWVVECEADPKRISCWTLDGTFKKDFFGNTVYGGGGCLDPYDKTRLFYGPMEFALDWQTGQTRLTGLTWQGDTPAGEQPIKVKDRLYLVTRPQFCGQNVGVVYLYDKGLLKRVAAVGRAGNYPPLRSSEILDSLGRKAIGTQGFAWSDLNADGKPQLAEVQFYDLADSRAGRVGRFEETLAIDGSGGRFDVKEILPNGVPVYERQRKPSGVTSVRLDSGNFFVTLERYAAALDAAGKPVWTHPAEGWGVHALNSAKPYHPGQVVAQFDVVGHETAHAGDLGEFLVTNSNTGMWHVWTADGLLAGQLFRDQRGPSVFPWSMREHSRGLDLTGATVGQEHFAGYFCRTREDDKYYVVAGHNHVSVAEVIGLDKMKRLGGDLQVTQPDIVSAIDWDRKQQARRIYESAKLIICRRADQPVAVNGSPDEWQFESASLTDRDISLAMAYDNTNLYLCYKVREAGPMKNVGNDWKRLFKTGAAVDLQLGLDPAAPRDRTSPVTGDSRLLFTVFNGKPTAVLYQPLAPGAKPEEAWETHTMVFKAAFDRVVQLPQVRLAVGHDADSGSYCVEAAVPFAALGLKPEPDMMLKFDWGVLVSGPDGNEVLQRLYWANPQTAIVSDEAAEAMLQPDLWGYVRFAGAAGAGSAAQDMPTTLDTSKPTGKTGRGGAELELDE